MDDDTPGIHPLDILGTYATAGQFVEARLARLKATEGADPAEIQLAEGLSSALFGGILDAVAVLEEVMVVPPDPERMLS